MYDINKKFKHTNEEVYAANEPNFLCPISYGTQQVEPQFVMAYQVHSYERVGAVYNNYITVVTKTSTLLRRVKGDTLSLV